MLFERSNMEKHFLFLFVQIKLWKKCLQQGRKGTMCFSLDSKKPHLEKIHVDIFFFSFDRMMRAFILVILVVYVAGDWGNLCYNNCACENDKVECYIWGCEDDLSILHPTKLIIHGTLCEWHRDLLMTSGKNIHLTTDLCQDLPNCV